MSSKSDSSTENIQLRDVLESDLPDLFEHQRDPEAVAMADFPSRDGSAFMSHWIGLLHNRTNVKQTILYHGQIAGNIVSWADSGKQFVGYWLGKRYWGQGIATAALSLFLNQVTIRPLYAHVARHNIASRRVLEKCGFIVQNATQLPTSGIDDLFLKLV